MAAQVDISSLTPQEKLDLIGELWDSFDESDLPLTDALREELDRRAAEVDADIQAGRPLGVPWAEVMRRLKSGSH